MPDNSSSPKSDKLLGLRRLFRQWRDLVPGKKSARAKNHELYGKILLLLGFSLTAALILYPRPQEKVLPYQVGDIAAHDVKATQDLLIEDDESTAKRRQELLDEVPLIYDFDERIGEDIRTRLHQAFETMQLTIREARSPEAAAETRGKKARPPASTFNRLYKTLQDKKTDFERLLGVTLSNNVFYLLAQAQFAPQVEELVRQQVSQILSQGVISEHATLDREKRRKIVVRHLPSWHESAEKFPEAFLNLDEAVKRVNFYCREMATDLPAGQRWALCELAQALVVPNLIPNRAETEERRMAALRDYKPVYFQVQKGEMLVREGERITPAILAKLQALQKEGPRGWWLSYFLATALLLGALVTLSFHTAGLFIRRLPKSLPELTFLAAILLLVALLDKGLVNLADTLVQVSPLVAKNLVYVLPVALAPMLVAFFIGMEAAVLTTFLAAAMASFLVEKSLGLFLYFTISGHIGVWGVRHCKKRWVVVRAGLFVGLANLVLVTVLKLLEYPVHLQDAAVGMIFGLGGGLAVGILATGLPPVIEMLFNFTSDIRLLELLNLDQPIMRDLMVMAPGTYHHSIIVGNMVEAAAEAIGANPMLAKCAAYYHDIGKIKKPAYFVENQLGRENKHEKLAPSMSSLILIAHVKDGVELARQNRVGKDIIDIIRQHHGTSFISYFYNKAKQLATSPTQINIEDYRYPGPRPQTKEAGLVLLADQVEAASKTLMDPTPARIQGMVQKIINNNFADGQLDECELTLKDLHQIARSFIKILGGIFHQRIEYPAPAEKTAADKKKHEDLDKQPAKKDTSKPASDQGKSRDDLKRLGIS